MGSPLQAIGSRRPVSTLPDSLPLKPERYSKGSQVGRRASVVLSLLCLQAAGTPLQGQDAQQELFHAHNH
jgi:hypothetical protein